jgi:hypothetical protein
MSQPEWELIYATDYSALYRDKTGVYDPELTIVQTVDDADEDDIEATAAVVYRFPLERCWRVTEPTSEATFKTFLTDMDPARESELPYPLRSYVPWYAKSLGEAASSYGMPIAELTDALCSDDPKALAYAFEAIGGHHGYDNFDQYPEEWTATEFEAWPERGPKLSTSECDEFTKGYVSCALWCGVMVYKHDDDCPCHEPATNGDAYDADSCECEPELESSSDEHDESELTDDAHKELTDDAHDFYASNVADLRASTLDMERCGHDFWLTRNRHGAGFWDDKGRGKDADAALDRLTEASHACGSQDLEQGANMKVSIQ